MRCFALRGMSSSSLWCSRPDKDHLYISIALSVMELYSAKDPSLINTSSFRDLYSVDVQYKSPLATARSFEELSAVFGGYREFLSIPKGGAFPPPEVIVSPTLIGSERNTFVAGDHHLDQVFIKSLLRVNSALIRCKIPTTIVLTFGKEGNIVKHEERWSLEGLSSFSRRIIVPILRSHLRLILLRRKCF